MHVTESTFVACAHGLITYALSVQMELALKKKLFTFASWDFGRLRGNKVGVELWSKGGYFGLNTGCVGNIKELVNAGLVTGQALVRAGLQAWAEKNNISKPHHGLELNIDSVAFWDSVFHAVNFPWGVLLLSHTN